MLPECEDVVIDTVYGEPMRIRRLGSTHRDAPLVMHLHGGAFGPDGFDGGRIVARLLAEAGASVISPDYPAGAEHPFPHALEASFALLHRLWRDRVRWAGKATRLFVAGEEAGGNLAAALAMVVRDRLGPTLSGQILIGPMLDAGLATCSMRLADAGPVGCKWADGWHDYLGSPGKAFHPYAVPAAATRLTGLAPAMVLTAEDDPMRDESLVYARRLRDSLVPARQHVIAAPTHWPEGFVCSPPPETSWVSEMRDVLAEFLRANVRPVAPVRPNYL